MTAPTSFGISRKGLAFVVVASLLIELLPQANSTMFWAESESIIRSPQARLILAGATLIWGVMFCIAIPRGHFPSRWHIFAAVLILALWVIDVILNGRTNWWELAVGALWSFPK